jgi:hypothetical protein
VSIPYRPPVELFDVEVNKPGGMNDELLPWNLYETYSGEQETWQDLHFDLMEAFDDGDLNRDEIQWYVALMAEMFHDRNTRTPWHVFMARMCFLHFEIGEA